MTFEERVRRVLAATQPGEVLTYAEVAAEADAEDLRAAEVDAYDIWLFSHYLRLRA